MNVEPLAPLAPTARRELMLAIDWLEGQRLVSRLAQVTGTPVDLAIKYLPHSVNRRLREIIKTVMFHCLDVAINSLDGEADLHPAPDWTGRALTAVTGGIGGFFGMAALPFELPLTTTLMLRSIAQIACAEGEDVRTIETKLACLEVFALGGGRGERNEVDLQYYAVRSVLTKLTQDVSRYMMERGAINASSPILARLIGEIASRFGFAVWERFASALVPIVGAAAGATINVIFTGHFERVARGHFIVRRLEREYGADLIRRHYAAATSGADVRQSRFEAAD